jgi:hypothetical protein
VPDTRGDFRELRVLAKQLLSFFVVPPASFARDCPDRSDEPESNEENEGGIDQRRAHGNSSLERVAIHG